MYYSLKQIGSLMLPLKVKGSRRNIFKWLRPRPFAERCQLLSFCIAPSLAERVLIRPLLAQSVGRGPLWSAASYAAKCGQGVRYGSLRTDSLSEYVFNSLGDDTKDRML